MKTNKNHSSSIIQAVIVVIKDLKNLAANSCKLLKAVIALLPEHLLGSLFVYLVFISLSILEREIAGGRLDWLIYK
jgi:hypothetical protein